MKTERFCELKAKKKRTKKLHHFVGWRMTYRQTPANSNCCWTLTFKLPASTTQTLAQGLSIVA